MNKQKSGMRGIGVYIIIVFAVICIWYWLSAGATSNSYTQSQFEKDLDKNQVKSVKVVQNREIPTGSLEVKFKDGTSKVLYVSDVNSIEKTMTKAGYTDYTVADVPAESWIMTLLPYLLVFGAMFILFAVMNNNAAAQGGGGKMMNFGKNRAKLTTQEENHIKFSDVAGLKEEKEEIAEIVDFLRDPGKYTRLGARIPKGVLLVGPPGTGKTLLAKAVAGEAGVPFFTISGSDFVEMFVGVGASRVRDLFEDAKKNAPCIVFIDEIDAVARRRGTGMGGGHDEREQTLNQLLSEMDGFDSSKGIVILGATNRPEVLDKALLRPGRFDRRIIVEKPDLKGRIDVLKVHSHDVLMDDTVNLEEIALATSGAVGADLANMVNEAAIMAVKDGRNVVSQKDLFEAVEVVFAGKEKKDRILGKEEKKIVAYHEVGHALVTTLLKKAEPVQKITIVPRTMGALGYVMQVPEEEKYLRTKEELISKIVTLYGGRAAEEIIFGDVTTGASNDIEQATNIARAMVTQYGMSEKFGLIGLESVQNRYLDGRTVMNCGEKTESEVDEEVMALLKQCYERAYHLIEESKDVLHELAAYLVERETITGKEFVRIYEEATGTKLKEDENKEPEVEETGNEEKQESGEDDGIRSIGAGCGRDADADGQDDIPEDH